MLVAQTSSIARIGALLAIVLPGLMSAQVRDSTGVRIIQASAPQFTGARAWRLAQQPVFSLGGGLPDAADEIHTGYPPIELSDGRFVITHNRTRSVRFYSSTGRLLHSVGRKGEGPGEFESMRLFRGRGDTVVVEDTRNSRLTWITPNGTIARMSPFRVRIPNSGYGQGMSLELHGTFSDGQLAITSWPLISLPPRAMQYQDSLLILRCQPTACTPTSVLRTPGFAMALTTTKLTSGGRIPLGSQTLTAVSGDRIFVNHQARAEVEEYSPDGKLRRIIRLDIPRRPISPAFVREQRSRPQPAAWDSWSPKSQAEWNLNREYPRPFAAFFPPFRALYADPDGGVYALESEDRTQPTTLAAFSPTGAFLARIPIPDNVSIRAVGRTGIYLTRTDEDGFTHLMLYRILKP